MSRTLDSHLRGLLSQIEQDGLTKRERVIHSTQSAQIEVGAAHVEEVTHIMPRVMDVLNSYLRAVDARDLEAPGALVKLRAQLLRRIRMVAGEARVHDLLVTEFVIN